MKCGNKECGVSTGFAGELTFGSGDLDDWGYWDYPCEACARDHEAKYPADGSCWPHPSKRPLSPVGDARVAKALKSDDPKEIEEAFAARFDIPPRRS